MKMWRKTEVIREEALAGFHCGLGGRRKRERVSGGRERGERQRTHNLFDILHSS